jgi:hypothetical protein
MSCFGIRLSRTKKILILVLGLIALVGLGVAPYSQLSTYAYAKEVPVQLGYNDVQEYWVLSSVISEKERFKMVLHAEDTEAVDAETAAKAESEVGLLFDPLLPISETDLDPLHYKWSNIWSISTLPAYDINDAGWLTTARYSVAVYKDGAELSKRDVNVNYKEQRVIQLETPHGTVTINNLGMLPQGVEVPSGDLAVLIDPQQDEHIVQRLDVVSMIEWWNDGGYVHAPAHAPWTDISYADFWWTVETHGFLPKDVNLVHVSDVTYIEDMDYVRLYYADIVFAGDVTVYIPSDLADTVIVHLYEPKPEFVSIEPSPIPAIDEGDHLTLSVTIKNVGTEGTMSVSVQSDRYAANPITQSFADFAEGETFTFRWELYALNVEQDTSTEVLIRAQGRGGTITQTIQGTILEVEGYTPPDPPPPPDPVSPSPTPSIPWEILILAAVGVVLVWLVWRRKK